MQVKHVLRTGREDGETLDDLAVLHPGKAGLTIDDGTDLERQLAAIWEDLLHVTPIGVHDNFFDLGGHSLMAVQLLSRLKREIGIDLSLEVVYSGELTIAEMAKAIELREFAGADTDEYAAILAEVESLSDEEVRALLEAEEQPDQSG